MYERGNFDSFATQTTARALFFFSLGMVGFGIQNILSRAFYAKQDGKTPFYSGLVSIAANIIFCFLLVDKMDVGGLALASAISSTLSALFLLVPLQKEYKNLIAKQNLTDLLKMLCSAAMMTIVAILLKNSILSYQISGIIGNLLVVVIPAAAGVIVYFILCYILAVPESRQVIDISKSILKKH